MKLSEKEVSVFKGISLAAGVFTLVVAITMIFSLVQLKRINPLDNPALVSVKEQFDRDPANVEKAEQVRSMDLMARKAYFSSRWQLETGSYLLLAGAIVFIVFQRLIAGNEKPARSLRTDKPDMMLDRRRGRRYLIMASGLVTFIAIVLSFTMRSELPATGKSSAVSETSKKAEASAVQEDIDLPGEINYPFFRGEGSRGIAGGTGFPTEWNGSEGKGIKWKIAVPKQGKSSPVIWDNKLFLTGAEGSKFEIYCIDKNSGEIIWTGSGSDFPGSSKVVPESDNEAGMAVPTPALNEKVVCAIFGNGNLVCYDHDGKLKWAKNVGVPQSSYGYSSSLVIYDKLLLVQYDSQDKITLSGYDLNTGEQKWETPRNGRPVNSSPVLATFGGEPQLLINGNPNVSSYNPVNGTELWNLPGVSGDVVPALAVNSKMVYAVTDYYKLIALKPGKDGSKIWDENTYTPDVSSPVANNTCLFVTTGYGDVACYNSETGDTLWTHYFDNPFYASPIICDKKVWMLDRTGIMHVVEESGKLRIISNSPLGENADCTPAFSEKKIYIRGRVNLYCIAEN